MSETNEPLPPPIENLEIVQSVTDADGDLHTAYYGYDRGLAEQLVVISTSGSDEMLDWRTSDSDRFETVEALEQWMQTKDRSVYWLAKEGELTGIAFFGPSEPLVEGHRMIPQKFEIPHTSGLRIYDGARRKGLGKELFRIGHLDHLERQRQSGKPAPDVFWPSDRPRSPSSSSLSKLWIQGQNFYGKKIYLRLPIEELDTKPTSH